MNSLKIYFLLFFVFAAASLVSAQTGAKQASGSTVVYSSVLRSSPAFAEIILRKTELQSELESLLIAHTEEFPRVKELRYEISALDKSIEKLSAIKTADSVKLTPALGKLVVRKAELETDYRSLQSKYGDEHPEVKRAKRKVEVYEDAIKEILQ